MKRILVFFLFLAASAAYGQVLWGGAKYGMTVTEIQQVRPSSSIGGDSSVLGAKQELEEAGVEVDDMRFTARYYFKDGGLHAIILAREKHGGTLPPSLEYKKIREALTHKYGKPVEAGPKDGTYSKLMNTVTFTDTWSSGDVTIGALMMKEKSGVANIFNISYNKIVSNTSKNL